MKDRKAFLLGGVALLLVLTAVGVLIHAQDPLAQYRAADGKLTIPGGQLTPELQRLLFPPPAPATYMTFAVKASSYPTIAYVGTSHDIPQVTRTNTPIGHPFTLPNFAELFRQAAGAFFGLFTMNGAAANRYLVLGDGGCVPANMATNANCWAAVSGGAGGAGVPTAVDAAFADAASGAGAGTQNAAMDVLSLNTTAFAGTWNTGNFALTSEGAMTLEGTFNAGSSTVTVHGNLDMNNITNFNLGTSTFVMAASGTLKTDLGSSFPFYNLTISLGVTTTMAGTLYIEISHAMTVNGTIAGPGGSFLDFSAIFGYALVPTPLTLGANGHVNGVATVQFTADASTPALNIASTSYNNLYLQSDGSAVTHTIGGNTTVASTLTVHGVTTGLVLSGSPTLTVGTVTIDNAAAYVQLGSASVSVSGNWSNASTSASWSAGAGTVSFTGSGAQTIGGAGTKNLFNNVIVNGTGQKNFTQNFTTSDFTAGTGSPTVQVTAGKTWTFTGNDIGGATVTFRSSASGSAWFIAPTLNSPSARYVSVSDSTATGNNVVAYFSNDLGGNTGWFFVGGASPPPSPTPQPQPQPQQPGTIPVPFSDVSVNVAQALFALMAISALTLIGSSALHVPLGRRTKATFVVLLIASAVAFAFTLWHI